MFFDYIVVVFVHSFQLPFHCDSPFPLLITTPHQNSSSKLLITTPHHNSSSQLQLQPHSKNRPLPRGKKKGKKCHSFTWSFHHKEVSVWRDLQWNRNFRNNSGDAPYRPLQRLTLLGGSEILSHGEPRAFRASRVQRTS